jgi:hypothetical protein
LFYKKGEKEKERKINKRKGEKPVSFLILAHFSFEASEAFVWPGK